MLSFCLWFLVFYAWHIFGVTVGLHRLLSHRGFRCHKLVEYFFVSGAYLAFHGSPLWWATIHRTHHRYVDTPLDPHGPANKGGFAAYAFYTPMQYPPHIDPAKQSKDLLKDPIYRFLEQPGKTWHRAYALCVGLSLLLRVGLWIAFGPIVAGASLLAGLVALNVPLLLNVFCHMPKLGYKNFQITDLSVNVWWMALICAGDGWHNNHHAYPASSNAGLRTNKWEIDPSWYVLRALKSVGLVTYINDSLNDDHGSDDQGKKGLAAVIPVIPVPAAAILAEPEKAPAVV